MPYFSGEGGVRLPSLEEPDPGTCCSKCGEPVRIEGFCARCHDGQFRTLAEAIRDEAHEIAEGRGPWEGRQYTCPDCGRPVLSLQHDGRCEECAGVPRQHDEHLYRERQRRGYLAAARVLRQMGFEDEAAWHEHRAGVQ